MKLFSTIFLLITLLASLGFAQESLSADYLKRIKEATPKPLPQSPGTRKQTSDAQDERLKGKVKSLFEERLNVSGASNLGPRYASEILEFDERGDFLGAVLFDGRGRPHDVVVYGYIDGVRASLYKSITYGDELRAITVGGKDKFKKETKPDLRFTYKYEYKFSAGRISEMLMIRNTGERGMRYTYNLDAGQLVELAYTDEDELNQKYVSKLDGNGNEIEMNSFDVWTGSVRGSNRYEYEAFDKQGNWTKRTESKLVVKNGKKVFEPFVVVFRTIKYYK